MFAQTAGFGAVFLLAVFIATVAGELTRGTFRTMLLQQPAAAGCWPGKVVAVVGFAAVLALLAEAVAWVTARLLAPGQGIDTSRWSSIDALGAAAEDYGRLVVFIAGWAVLATLVGVLVRSVPIGVGVGLVWAGPIENVIGEGWAPGERWFPGLVLRALISAGLGGDLHRPGADDAGCLLGRRRRRHRHRPPPPRRHVLIARSRAGPSGIRWCSLRSGPSRHGPSMRRGSEPAGGLEAAVEEHAEQRR